VPVLLWGKSQANCFKIKS